ncbi:hypothetical protein BGX20_007208 [Mortierella sp. AD010]|nr:hypothetical protein BGX20_007208 [Mortierella sp. AD010]
MTAINAQFVGTPCSACLIGTIPADSLCKTLDNSTFFSLVDAVKTVVNTNNTGDIDSIVRSSPAAKDCICDWAHNVFTSDRSSSVCTFGTPPICDASDIGSWKTSIDPLYRDFCDISPNPPTNNHAGLIGGLCAGLIAVIGILGFLVWRNRKAKTRSSENTPVSNPLFNDYVMEIKPSDGQPSDSLVRPSVASENTRLTGPEHIDLVEPSFSTHPRPNVVTIMASHQMDHTGDMSGPQLYQGTLD